jgi:hypothetical protein
MVPWRRREPCLGAEVGDFAVVAADVEAGVAEEEDRNRVVHSAAADSLFVDMTGASASKSSEADVSRSTASRSDRPSSSVIVCSASPGAAIRAADRGVAFTECGQHGDCQPLEPAFPVGPFFAQYRLGI